MMQLLILTGILFFAGVLSKLLKRTPNVFMGYGLGRLTTPRRFEVVNNLGGNILITYSLLQLLTVYFIEKFTGYTISKHHIIAGLILLALVLCVSIHFRLNKLMKEIEEGEKK